MEILHQRGMANLSLLLFCMSIDCLVSLYSLDSMSKTTIAGTAAKHL